MNWMDRYWWAPGTLAVLILVIALVVKADPPFSPSGDYYIPNSGLPTASTLCYVDVDWEEWVTVELLFEWDWYVVSSDSLHVLALKKAVGFTEEDVSLLHDVHGLNYGAILSREDGQEFFDKDSTLSGHWHNGRVVSQDSLLMEEFWE